MRKYILQEESPRGSIVGGWEVVTARTVGEASERISLERAQVVQKPLDIIGLSPLVDKSEDYKNMCLRASTDFLKEGSVKWRGKVQYRSMIEVGLEVDKQELKEEDHNQSYYDNIRIKNPPNDPPAILPPTLNPKSPRPIRPIPNPHISQQLLNPRLNPRNTPNTMCALPCNNRSPLDTFPPTPLQVVFYHWNGLIHVLSMQI